MKYADLHIHTYYSDSTSSPEEVIKLAEDAGVSAIAVTDHDTIDSLQPLLKIQSNVEIIPAVELSTKINNTEAHILGYFIDPHNQELLKKLAEIKQIRKDRVYKFGDKLKTIGVDIEPEKIIESAKYGTVGRMHIARYLIEKKYASCMHEVFRKYLGDSAPGYISVFRLTPRQAIRLIKNAGGVAVLAHPYTISNQGLVTKIINDGIDGLEVYYPERDGSQQEHYKTIAEKHGLLLTGGSDFHGELKKHISIGIVKIPYILVEKLKAARANMAS